MFYALVLKVKMSVKKIKVKQEGDAGKVVKKPKRESDVGGVDKVVKKKPKLEAVETKKVSKLTSMPAKALKVAEHFSRFDLEHNTQVMRKLMLKPNHCRALPQSN